MRLLFASSTFALCVSLSPAFAMCGSEQASGMCGASSNSKMMSEKSASEWPMAPEKSQPAQQGAGMRMMCPCCRNMAMMDGMKADDPHKGMDMQKQQ
jgi:hypothetical protein